MGDPGTSSTVNCQLCHYPGRREDKLTRQSSTALHPVSRRLLRCPHIVDIVVNEESTRSRDAGRVCLGQLFHSRGHMRLEDGRRRVKISKAAGGGWLLYSYMKHGSKVINNKTARIYIYMYTQKKAGPRASETTEIRYSVQQTFARRLGATTAPTTRPLASTCQL